MSLAAEMKDPCEIAAVLGGKTLIVQKASKLALHAKKVRLF